MEVGEGSRIHRFKNYKFLKKKLEKKELYLALQIRQLL